ncbi:MAG: winged helix-turn-helix transcriptional regulator [Planctomycetota bacterium]
MLVPLMLLREGALHDPLLYISLFLKEHREEYYGLLQRTRTESAWTEWIRFFLEAVTESANEAVRTAQDLNRLFATDRDRIRQSRSRPGSVLQVHDVLQRHPFQSIPRIAATSGLTQPTVSKAIELLEELGIVVEVTGKKRDRVYLYQEYVRVMNA